MKQSRKAFFIGSNVLQKIVEKYSEQK